MRESPLRRYHEQYAETLCREARDRMQAMAGRGAEAGGSIDVEPGVEYITYGDSGEDAGEGRGAVEIVATYGLVEAEYAAIRRGAGVLDCPQRGTLRVRGADRRALLDRLLTQALGTLSAGACADAFWLNRKGRIEADVLLAELDEETLIDLDGHVAAPTAAGLEGFVFADDVEIQDVSAHRHQLRVHGHRALEAVGATGAAHVRDLGDHRATRASIAGADVVVARRDETGEPGLILFVPVDDVGRVWEALVAPADDGSARERRVRPIGWYAYNTARIEAGTPIFMIDFGTTSLPHETGVLRERVSFTKGCFVGQEVVARTENLGRPRQTLVGLRVEGDVLPVAGAQVFDVAGGDSSTGTPVGVVTSSTISPMLGGAPIAFAMLRRTVAEPGSTVLVNAEDRQSRASVGPLCFWSRD